MRERGKRVRAPGWKIARVFGIDIRVDPSWLVIFGLIVWSLARGVFPSWDEEMHGERVWAEWQYWLMGAIAAIMSFACVLAHELGHSLVARRHGIEMKDITLFIFGGMARMSGGAEEPRAEFRMAIAGPIVSLLLAAAFWALYLGLNAIVLSQVVTVFRYLGYVNTMLLAFNLFPGFPLDGGRVLRAYLWRRYDSEVRATRVAAQLGKVFGFVLMGLGIMVFLGEGGLAGLWFVVIGLFLRNAADASCNQVLLKHALSRFHVRDLIRANGGVAVDADLCLERLVEDYFYRYRHRRFPVVADDVLVGVIALKDLRGLPRYRWDEIRVAEAMRRMGPEDGVRLDDDAISVFGRMTVEEKSDLPVLEDGRLVGIISRDDIVSVVRANFAPGRG